MKSLKTNFGAILSLPIHLLLVHKEEPLYLCGWAGCRSRWPDDEPCLNLAGQPADAHRTTHSDPWRAERENKKRHPPLHSTFLNQLPLCCVFYSQTGNFSGLDRRLGKPSVLKYSSNTEMGLGSICIIYAFVLQALEGEWGMRMQERERLSPWAVLKEKSGDEIKFTRLKSVIKTRADSQAGHNPWVTRLERCSSNMNTEE